MSLRHDEYRGIHTYKDPELDEFYRILELHWSEHRDDASSDEEDVPALLAIEDGPPDDGYESIDGVAEHGEFSVRRQLFASGDEAMMEESMEEEAMEVDEEVEPPTGIDKPVVEECPPPLPDLPGKATTALRPVVASDGVKHHDAEDKQLPCEGGKQHDAEDKQLLAKGGKQQVSEDKRLLAEGGKQQDSEDKQLPAEGGKQQDSEDKQLPSAGAKQQGSEDKQPPSQGGKQHDFQDQPLDDLARGAEQMKERLRQGLQAKVALLRPRSLEFCALIKYMLAGRQVHFIPQAAAAGEDTKELLDSIELTMHPYMYAC